MPAQKTMMAVIKNKVQLIVSYTQGFFCVKPHFNEMWPMHAKCGPKCGPLCRALCTL